MSLIEEKIAFLKHYVGANNAAEGSEVDSNANVKNKNINTMEAELFKPEIKKINRLLMRDELKKFGTKDGISYASYYLHQLESNEIYKHDETALRPYCSSISMYAFLVDGMKGLGGESKAPQHLESFCGSFINMVFAAASNIAGAVATVEFLLYFDHFARKDLGRNYLKTDKKKIENHLQHVVYALNQPAAARNYQSVFWNISLFDRSYFKGIFGDFVFPSGESPDYDSLADLQEFFLSWLNKERTVALLTFPVITAALLQKDGIPQDERFFSYLVKELSEGNSFFIYSSENADSLSSCCRLRNELADNTFSYTLGAGGVATGSVGVITLNMNRLVQKTVCMSGKEKATKEDFELIRNKLKTQIEFLHVYHIAYRNIIKKFVSAGMIPLFTSGFVALKKLYSTLGINGLLESAEYLGITIGNNEEYLGYLQLVLKTFKEMNTEASKKQDFRYNTEMVPAEQLGVKFAKQDLEDGLLVSRPVYNSYFYPSESDSLSEIEKMILHGKQVVGYLDGGSALHLNLETLLTSKGYDKLLRTALQLGCNYFTTNTTVTICRACGYINKETKRHCVVCSSIKVDYATRVIGYLSPVSQWSKERREEFSRRFKHKILHSV